MVSSFSPPVLYLSDDDDDNEIEQNIPHAGSFASVTNDHLPRKKRKFTDTNVRINPSIVNWSKRQRNDHYQHQQPIYNSHHHHQSETNVHYPDEYNFADQESHSFHAFDWSSEPRTATTIYSNPIQTTSRVSTVPPPTVMNVVKHHLDQSDAIPLIPLSHHSERYFPHSQRKSTHIPISITPPLPLPLPTPTSSFVRPHAQHIQPGKNIRIPYTRSTSPPPPPLSVHHQMKPVFPTPTYRPPSPASISIPISTPEIRRQALNGTGTLSAFYDSKCYRCNICKFKSITSSILLQHLFTHIFFCDQCPFYSYSHHHLYKHIFENHSSSLHYDHIDPKNLELLYLTRCPDGTFALCMDSSPPPPAKTKTTTTTTTTTKTDEKVIKSTDTTKKPKTPRRKPPKPKKDQDNDIILLSEKRDINPQPSSSSSSSSSVIPKRPLLKEKQINTYVLMKHRRCYSIRSPPCSHSLSLEYNICREHTIRQMCHTQGLLKRQKVKSNSNVSKLVDEVAFCLKTMVNHIVNTEENSNLSDAVCPLPNYILDLIFPMADLNILTNLLKLNNKHAKSIEQKHQYRSESSVRRSNQHIFILSSSGINKNEQSIFDSFHTSITNADSMFTNTKLNQLPISYDNTHRFLKGNINIFPRPANSTTNKDEKIPRPNQSKDTEVIPPTVLKPPRYTTPSSNSPMVDKNNNSVLSSSKSQLSPTPSVIVID